MKHFRDIEALETFDYDESEAQQISEALARDCVARESENEQTAFDSVLREYHAR